MIINWSPITETEWIPPFGDELKRHLESKQGTVLHASCSAWSLLYKTLIENGLGICEVRFTVTGKPYFKNSNLYFSISHSHDLCTIAISDAPVGVDIEIVKDHYNPHLIERSLCGNEKAVFDGNFTRFWSCKEAIAKMTGKGITGYPTDIDTTQYEFVEEKISYRNKEYWCCAISGEMCMR